MTLEDVAQSLINTQADLEAEIQKTPEFKAVGSAMLKVWHETLHHLKKDPPAPTPPPS